ncbi:flagellar biosynthesis protein FlhA [Chitinibacteraceae bacterium HSL-7]
MSSIVARVSRNSDISLVAGIFCILLVLFAPIPAGLLDFLIICNFSFSILLLLLTFYTEKPTDFSTFPSMLLIATLFRLSLNVAATRLILGQADAGHVINAVGDHVVGGNYVIGVIVFLILVVVQYVVVTAGAQRVAEVAARFTLDSMPGRQMSIDADLNMGFIDQAEAQARRKALEKEANFYGAMDGASKFVKGDAIAGLIILAINIIGGFAIGVMQHNMSWDAALQRYVLLTIGDGIVTQVPALVISVGTGIIVTRSVGDRRLSNEVLRQLAGHPRALILVALVLCAMMLLPGVPVWPMMILLAVLASVLPIALTKSRKGTTGEAVRGEVDGDIYAEMAIHPIEVQIGSALPNSQLKFDEQVSEHLDALRKSLALETGVVMPEVVVRIDARADPHAYCIRILGVTCGVGQLYPDLNLAIAPAKSHVKLSGIDTVDPAYGLPAIWIDTQQVAVAEQGGYTLADAMTVFVTHFSDIIRKQLSQLLSRAETERLVNRVRASQPTLIDELVPNILSLSDVQRVLQGLLQEEIPVRNVEQILEILVDQGRTQKDVGLLVERVRQRLSATVYQSLLGASKELLVVTLDPATELAIAEGLKSSNLATPMVLDPKLAEQLIIKLSDYSEKTLLGGDKPILLCQPEVRRGLRSFIERVIPHMAVLSITELPPQAKVRGNGVIQISVN